MLSTTLKSLFRELFVFFQRFQDMLAALGAERRCAQRLDRLADRLLGMGESIDALRQRLHQQPLDAQLDADQSLRNGLKALKEEIREARCQLSCLQGADLPARQQRAYRRLSTIAEATYAAADKLQWEIDDHDTR
jgi:hypothetical protein